jgi:hypothetical protein
MSISSDRIALVAAAFWMVGQAPARASFHFGLGNAAAAEGAKVVNKANSEYMDVGGVALPALPSCGGNMALFTHLPVTDPNLINVAPLGSQLGHIQPPDHMYFNFAIDPGSSVVTYAPGNGWIIQIVGVTYPNDADAPGGINPNYYFVFSPCREVTLFTGQGALSPALAAAVASAGAQTTCSSFNQNLNGGNGSCVTNLELPVHAGDVLTTGAVPDFGALLDTRFQLSGFANPSRHNLNRGFCPLNYFAPGVLTATYTPGYIDGTTPVPRTASPLCGTIVQDIPGTAQGDWYSPAADPANDNAQMALVHDIVLTSTAVFSVGSDNSVPAIFQGKNFFAPKMSADGTHINYDFGLVSDNQIYCYDTFASGYPVFNASTGLTGYIVLLQLTDPAKDTLQIEIQDPMASCTATAGTWAFTSNAITFQR